VQVPRNSAVTWWRGRTGSIKKAGKTCCTDIASVVRIARARVSILHCCDCIYLTLQMEDR